MYAVNCWLLTPLTQLLIEHHCESLISALQLDNKLVFYSPQRQRKIRIRLAASGPCEPSQATFGDGGAGTLGDHNLNSPCRRPCK